MFGARWDGGSKSTFIAVDLATGRVSDPDARAFGSFARPSTPTVDLPVGVAIVEHAMFCGKDTGCTIYLRPENAAPLLPSGPQVTAEQRAVLEATAANKSSYGGDREYRRHASGLTREVWDRAKAECQAAGWLTAAGAITVAGRNVRSASKGGGKRRTFVPGRSQPKPGRDFTKPVKLPPDAPRCNCESMTHGHAANHCPRPAGRARALYVGAVCDACASAYGVHNLLLDAAGRTTATGREEARLASGAPFPYGGKKRSAAHHMGITVTRSPARPAANGGTQAAGTAGGFTYAARVFPKHAADPAWELNQSQISQLTLRDVLGNVVFKFDRGVVKAATQPAVKEAVAAVEDALARAIFGRPLGQRPPQDGQAWRQAGAGKRRSPAPTTDLRRRVKRIRGLARGL
jgi:hypothetical protein